MATILSHFGAHGWHFADLVALGARVFTSQPPPAAGAGSGSKLDDVIYFFRGQKPSGTALMAGLAAALALLRLALRTRLIRGRV